MITSIRLLRSIGQFDYAPAGAIALARHVLIYAENGRGKTTLAAILRSLASGDPIPIHERRRLAAAHPPHAVLQTSNSHEPLVFERGAWNRPLPSLRIFDDLFVDQNVYSGLSVEPGHRQNLHELVIGARGVALNRELQNLVHQIETHNANLRMRAAAIPEQVRGPFTVDQFCDLQPVDRVEGEIQVAERNAAAAQQQRLIRDSPEFEPLNLPRFDAESLNATLQLDLPTLANDAAAQVQAHFQRIGRGGEAWVSDGMPRIARVEAGRERCPFCDQDLAGARLIAHYREYFSDRYARLKQRIAEALNDLNRTHSREIPGRFERSLREATTRREFWARFCDVPETVLESERLLQQWQTARDLIAALLETKKAAPLERMQLTEEARTVLDNFARAFTSVEHLNEQLQRANADIRTLKRAAVAGVDAQAANRTLARVRAIRDRYLPEISPLCDDYLAERNAKTATEARRDDTQQQLEQYRATEFPQYESCINVHLERFNAGFLIRRVAAADTRGGPTCNYSISINDIAVPVSGAQPAPGDHWFGSTLSSGDRNSLALAFFFASLERDTELNSKIVVIDDPISSLDDHRALTTAQELRRLGQRASQIIVLSHDKRFLCSVWQGLDRFHCTALSIDRDGTG